MEQTVYLPITPEMSPQQLQRLIDSLRRAVAATRRTASAGPMASKL
jgi:hypothetical protein